MGCDIHTIVQVLEGGAWITKASNVHDWRNYLLWGMLADVRGYCEDPIDDPRGLPKDLVTTIDQFGGLNTLDENGDELWLGYHSHSWLILDEIIDYKNQRKEEEEVEALEMLIEDIIMSVSHRTDKSKIRFVFGFDS